MKTPRKINRYLFVKKLHYKRVFVLVDERGKLWVDWNLVELAAIRQARCELLQDIPGRKGIRKLRYTFVRARDVITLRPSIADNVCKWARSTNSQC